MIQRKKLRTVKTAANRPAVKPRSSESILDRIKPVSEREDAHGRSALIYGRSGTGKTTFAGTWPGPVLVLDIKEDGTESVGNVKSLDVLAVESWGDVEAVYWHLKSGNHEYKTVVIDQITAMQALAMDEVRKSQGLSETDTMSRRGWGEVSGKMVTWLTNYRDLVNDGINVCFIAHDREHGGDDNADDEQISPSVGARAMPSVASALNGLVSIIGNTFIREQYDTVKKRVDGKVKISKTRVVEYGMRVGPHAIYTTKIRSPKEVPTPDAILDPTFEKVVSVMKGTLIDEQE